MNQPLMPWRLWLASTALIAAAAPPVAQPATQGTGTANPFAQPSTLPFQAPRFDQIRDGDYQPAFDRAIAAHLVEVKTIADNPAAPTFDNTIAALDRSGRMYDRVRLAFDAIVQANTNPMLDKVQEIEAPKRTAHDDAIHLDAKLFRRIETLYAARATLALDPEQRQLLETDHAEFVHAGARLSDANKAKLRTLNGRISSLETQFEQKLLVATTEGALVVGDKASLAGLAPDAAGAAEAAARERKLPGKFVLPLQNTTQQPALASLADRTTRATLFDHSWTRAEKGNANDTRATIATLAMLRAQKAQLLGYPNYAAYVLYDQMAKTPEAAEAFIARLIPATAAEQKREVVALQQAIRANGKDFALRPWDWQLYSDRLRKASFDLDEATLKPYFELDRVLRDGVFFAASQLYGLSFKERKDIPVYQPDVRVFEVFEENGQPLGLIYFDYFKRDNKAGGAWMSNLVEQSKALGTKPVVYNVANFSKPAPGQPALISFDDVTTMFHEFGHALHGLFADQTYLALSGTNTARDFVEFPSQFNEHWALDPIVLSHYARNYRTGESMPLALADRLRKAATFNQGYALGEIVAAAKLDMDWHTLSPDMPKQNVDAFETASLARSGLDVTHVPPRYRSSYFRHIWGNDYAAGYYAYLWSEMLDDDVYAWMRAHGGLTRANGQRLRDMILSRGHTEDYGTMFRAFYGKDPNIEPMLRHRGIQPGGD